MIIVITANVPDEWQDLTDETGILEGPYNDLIKANQSVGAEDIDIRAAD